MGVDVKTFITPAVVFGLATRQLALRLRDGAAECDADGIRTITSQLLNDIHEGAIPSEIFRIWLPLTAQQVPSLIGVALLDKVSNGVRESGIEAFRKGMSRDTWREDTWDAVGGTQGLVNIFQSISIVHVQKLSRAIGESNYSKDPTKTSKIEELAQILIPTLSPPSETARARFLFREFAALIPACSRDFVAGFLSQKLPDPRLKKTILVGLTHYHVDLAREIILGEAEVPKEIRKELTRLSLKRLIFSIESYQSKVSHFDLSANVCGGIYFFLDVIKSEDDKDVPTQDKLNLSWDLIHAITRSVTRHKISLRDQLAIFDSIISWIEIKTNGSNPGKCASISWSNFTWQHLLRCWAATMFGEVGVTRGPKAYPIATSESDLELGTLFQGLVIRIAKLSALAKSAPGMRCLPHMLPTKFPCDARLPLIKILIQHQPDVSIDLDIEPPSARRWPQGVRLDVRTLFKLPAEDAKWLFERLIASDGLDIIETRHWRVFIQDWTSKPIHPTDFEALLRLKWATEESPNNGELLAEKSK